jgi:hypothetical protein
MLMDYVATIIIMSATILMHNVAATIYIIAITGGDSEDRFKLL